MCVWDGGKSGVKLEWVCACHDNTLPARVSVHFHWLHLY